MSSSGTPGAGGGNLLDGIGSSEQASAQAKSASSNVQAPEKIASPKATGLANDTSKNTAMAAKLPANNASSQAVRAVVQASAAANTAPPSKSVPSSTPTSSKAGSQSDLSMATGNTSNSSTSQKATSKVVGARPPPYPPPEYRGVTSSRKSSESRRVLDVPNARVHKMTGSKSGVAGNSDLKANANASAKLTGSTAQATAKSSSSSNVGSSSGAKTSSGRRRNAARSVSTNKDIRPTGHGDAAGSKKSLAQQHRALKDIHLQPSPFTAVKFVRSLDGSASKGSFASKLTMTNTSNDLYIFRVFKMRPDFEISSMAGILAPQKPFVLKIKVVGKLFSKTDAALREVVNSGKGNSLQSSTDTFVVRFIRLTSKQTKKLIEKPEGSAAQIDVLTSFLGDNDRKRSTDRKLPIVYFISRQAKHVSDKKHQDFQPETQRKTEEKAKATASVKEGAVPAKSLAKSNSMANSGQGEDIIIRHRLNQQARRKGETLKIMDKIDGGAPQKNKGGLLAALRQAAAKGVTVTFDRNTSTLEICGIESGVQKVSDSFMCTKTGRGKFEPAARGAISRQKIAVERTSTRASAQERAAEALREAATKAAQMSNATLSDTDRHAKDNSENTERSSVTTRFMFSADADNKPRLQKCYAKLYGRNRVTLLKMQRKSGASISILKQKGQVHVTGNAAQVNSAREMILKHVRNTKVAFTVDPKYAHEPLCSSSPKSRKKSSSGAAKDSELRPGSVGKAQLDEKKTSQYSEKVATDAYAPDDSVPGASKSDEVLFSQMHVRTQLERARKNGFISLNQHKRWLQDLRTRRRTQQVRNALSKALSLRQKRALVREQKEQSSQNASQNNEIAMLQHNLQQLQLQLEQHRAEAKGIAAAASDPDSSRNSTAYPFSIAVKIFQHASIGDRRKIFEKVPFKELKGYAQNHHSQLSFDTSECMMYFKSRNVKHLKTALSYTSDRIAKILKSDPRSTGMVIANKVRSMDFKQANKVFKTTLCVTMDSSTKQLLKGNHGGFALVLQAGYSAHVLVSTSTACIQIQGSAKRVADVCNLLNTVLSSVTLWSISHRGTGGGSNSECVVLVERQCREEAMEVLIGGENRKMLLEIEQKSGAKIKYVPNKQLKLYIQGSGLQISAARSEIKQRLIKLGAGLVGKVWNEAGSKSVGKKSKPIPSEINDQIANESLQEESRNAKIATSLSGSKNSNNVDMYMNGAAAHSMQGNSKISSLSGSSVGDNNNLDTSFMQPASPMGVPVNQRLYLGTVSKMQYHSQKMQQMRLMMGTGALKSVFPPDQNGSGLHPLGMFGGASGPPGPKAGVSSNMRMMGMLSTVCAIKLSSDEFLSKCGAGLCGAFHSERAPGDKFLCASILMCAVKGSKGLLWNIEDGDTPWTCIVAMNKGAEARWKLFVQLHAKVVQKAAARKVCRFIRSATKDALSKRRAQVSIAAKFRSWSVHKKYKVARIRRKAILHLQSTLRMWRIRLCMSKKWKRCSSCCYRLPDTCFSSSQIKKGAKRTCLLPRCKDAARSLDPDEVKIVRNMFPVKPKRRTLHDIEKHFQQKIIHVEEGGEDTNDSEAQSPGLSKSNDLNDGQFMGVASSSDTQRVLPGIQNMYASKQYFGDQGFRSNSASASSTPIIHERQPQGGQPFMQQPQTMHNFAAQQQFHQHRPMSFQNQNMFSQLPSPQFQSMSYGQPQVGNVQHGTERAALLSLLDRARETVLNAEMHAKFKELVHEGKEAYVQEQLLDLYQANSSRNIEVPLSPAQTTSSPPSPVRSWSDQQGQVMKPPVSGNLPPGMGNPPPGIVAGSWGSAQPVANRAGSAPPGFDSIGTMPQFSGSISGQVQPAYAQGLSLASVSESSVRTSSDTFTNKVASQAPLKQVSELGDDGEFSGDLPYGGDLMAAQRAQDRPAIKILINYRNMLIERGKAKAKLTE